jgi:hypothetical protein
MTFALTLFGLFVVALGIAGVASPRRLLAVVTRAQSQMGLYSIACVRLLLGMALLLAASGFEAILAWWRRRASWVVRLWSLFVALFGASLVWAVLPLERAV